MLYGLVFESCKLWSRASDKRYLSREKAEKLIEEKRAEEYRKSVSRAIGLLEKEKVMVKEMGYKLIKI